MRRTFREEKDVNIGISRVPDLRLDTLTAMYNPRKRVPATIEFADLAAPTRTGAGAQALVDVAAYKNADALVHVVRAFKNPAYHILPARSIPHATLNDGRRANPRRPWRG